MLRSRPTLVDDVPRHDDDVRLCPRKELRKAGLIFAELRVVQIGHVRKCKTVKRIGDLFVPDGNGMKLQSGVLPCAPKTYDGKYDENSRRDDENDHDAAILP